MSSKPNLAAVMAVLLFVISLIYAGWAMHASSLQPMMPAIPYNELVKTGIDTRVELGRTLFQVGLVIAGALWAEVILKITAKNIRAEGRQVFLSVLASLLLLISFICHVVFLYKMSTIYVDAGRAPAFGSADHLFVPDPFGPNLSFWFRLQISFLFAGCLVTIITFATVLMRRRGSDIQ